MLATVGSLIGGQIGGVPGTLAGRVIGAVVEDQLRRNQPQDAIDPSQAIVLQDNGESIVNYFRNLNPTAGAVGNFTGNLATQGNVGLQQGTVGAAQRIYTDPNDMALQNQQMANDDQERLFRLGQQGAAYQNQLQQDIERGRTYNTLATQGQNLAAQNAQTLANAYTQARNANAQLLQGAIGAMGVR